MYLIIYIIRFLLGNLKNWKLSVTDDISEVIIKYEDEKLQYYLF